MAIDGIQSMQGRVTLVTGAADGIGRASACLFAERGARVLLADVNRTGLEETAQMIRVAGGEARIAVTDVRNPADVEAMVASAHNAFGRLDFAHNNAGTADGAVGMAPLHEQDVESFDNLMSINLRGVWLCLKYEIPALLAAGGGAIVNTASVLGLIGTPLLGPYVASKHGVCGLTKTAALEYARHNIRVNAVCPGLIETAMTEPLMEDPARRQAYLNVQPIRRMGSPQEVAEAVVWLCSDAASFVTGHMMSVDGGQVAH